MPINIKQKLKWGLVIILFLLIGMYAYGRSKAVRQGVIIEVQGVTEGISVTDSTLHLSGTAKNAVKLSLDDRPVVVDLNGVWSEQLLLLPGYNILALKAEDRFGKKTEKIFHIIYNPPTNNELVPTPEPAKNTETIIN